MKECCLDDKLSKHVTVTEKRKDINVSRKQCFESDQVDGMSLGLSSESPLTSPSRSKSSSCDTLDSLDSGLESSTSFLTGSHDSLDSFQNASKPHLHQIGHLNDPYARVPDLNPVPIIEAQLSPLGSPILETDDEASPTLIGFRKTDPASEVRKFRVGLWQNLCVFSCALSTSHSTRLVSLFCVKTF